MKKWIVTGVDVPALKGFDDAAYALMSQNDVLGLSLAVVYHGRLVLARGYSWFDSLEFPNEPITQPTSEFRIASLSKVITLIAVHQLFDEGLVTPDTPVQPYLAQLVPAWTDTDPRLQKVTIRHLLSHTGGWLDTPVASKYVRAAAIAKWILSHPNYSPGALHYSNDGYLMLGILIEVVRGRGKDSYPECVHDTLFDRIDISRPRIGDKKHGPNEVQNHYTNDPHSTLPDTYFNPSGDASGCWVLSATDYAQMIAALHHGATNPFFPKNPIATEALMFDASKPDYYSGWHHDPLPDGTIEFWKEGGYDGTISYVSHHLQVSPAPKPEESVSIIALWNSSPPDGGGYFDFHGQVHISQGVAFNLVVDDVNAAGNWPAHDLFLGLGWEGWEKLGPAGGAPGATLRGSHASVYSAGPDQMLQQFYWNGAAWVHWTANDGLALGSPPAPIALSENEELVFVRALSGRLIRRRWTAGNGWQPSWDDLDGNFIGRPAVVSRHPGLVEVYVCSPTHHLWRIYWDGATLHGWHPIDESFELGSAPAAISRNANEVEIYVRGGDGHLYQKWWNGKAWSAWLPLGGSLAGPPSVVSRRPGLVEVFGVDPAGALNQRTWREATGWNDWFCVDAAAKVDADIAALARGKFAKDIYARGQSQQLVRLPWRR